jgi:hypothetical protein
MVSYLATAMLAVSVLASDPQPVEWKADYGDALAETRSGDKPLLVVLDQPKDEKLSVKPALLSEGSTKAEDAERLEGYNLCHVDASTEYGQKVAKAFKAKRFPHLAIIDRSGKVVIFKKSGQISETEWENTLASHRDGKRPSARRVSYKVGGQSSDSTPAYRNNSYCPSCQRNNW